LFPWRDSSQILLLKFKVWMTKIPQAESNAKRRGLCNLMRSFFCQIHIHIHGRGSFAVFTDRQGTLLIPVIVVLLLRTIIVLVLFLLWLILFILVQVKKFSTHFDRWSKLDKNNTSYLFSLLIEVLYADCWLARCSLQYGTYYSSLSQQDPKESSSCSLLNSFWIFSFRDKVRLKTL